MKRAIIYVVILGIVCTGLGVAVGVAIDKRYTTRHLPRIARFAYRERPEPGAPDIFRRIGQKLDLSSEQRDQLKAILEESKQEVKQARDEFRAQVEQLKEKNHAQILELLNPEQKEKFQRLIARPKIRER